MIWAVGLLVGIWVDYSMTIVYIVAGVMAGLIFLSGIAKAAKTKTQQTS
ncbi:hypothetical protein ACFLVR_01785 [Chloroflexota bacterium]